VRFQFLEMLLSSCIMRSSLRGGGTFSHQAQRVDGEGNGAGQ